MLNHIDDCRACSLRRESWVYQQPTYQEALSALVDAENEVLGADDPELRQEATRRWLRLSQRFQGVHQELRQQWRSSTPSFGCRRLAAPSAPRA